MLFTVTDARSSGVLAGLGISCELCSRGSDQAVVRQLLDPQVPWSAAVYSVVPRGDAPVFVVLGAVRGKDQGLRGGCDA